VPGFTQESGWRVTRVSPTGLSPSTAERIQFGSATRVICNSPVALWGDRARSYNPDCTTPTGFHAVGLGCSPFARHYSGNRDFLSIPLGTQMCHFPRFPPRILCVQMRVTGHYPRRVSPFGNPRIIARLRLNEAYRSLPRPSSASGAKASAIRPYYLSGIGMSRLYDFQRSGTYTLSRALVQLAGLKALKTG
jgi:hypothetical protein